MKKIQEPIAGATPKPKRGTIKAKRTKKEKVSKPSRGPYELPQKYVPHIVLLDHTKAISQEEQFEIDALASQAVTFENAGDWPELFFLLKTNQGKYKAELQGQLKDKFEALTANLGNDELAIKVALDKLQRMQPKTLKNLQSSLAAGRERRCWRCRKRFYILPGSSGVIGSIESVIEIVMLLKDAIGQDLHTMRYFREGGEHVEAANQVVACMTKAVWALNDRSCTPKKHGNNKSYPYTDRYGKEFMAPLPWLAIEQARILVEELQRLPSKAEVRARLASLYPDLKEPKRNGKIQTTEDLGKAKRTLDVFWTHVYAKAGLTKLDKAAPWDKEKKRPSTKSATAIVPC